MNASDMARDLHLQMRSLRERGRAIIDSAAAEGRSDLNDDELARSNALLAEYDKAKAKRDKLLAMAQEDAEEDYLMSLTPTPAAPGIGRGVSAGHTRTASIRVGREPTTYRKQGERSSSDPDFLTDLYRTQVLNDPSAGERLSRHGQEMLVEKPDFEKRAAGTGAVPGFIPPAYLDELFAEYARAGRPVANLCTRMELPAEGMTVNLPRLTTPTTAGVQTAENNALSNQDPASTLLTVPVVTVGGYVILSRQAVERGNLTERVVASDLAADYNSKLDTQLLNGTGSSGQHLGMLNVSGLNAVTYTAASPVLVGATTPMWPKLASAVGQVMSGRFAGPTAMVMSPTEWAWMLAATDPSTNRPIIQPNQGGNQAFNAAGIQDGRPDYRNATGPLFNLPVALDGNMPANLGGGTNETRIIVADFEDCYLFEDSSGAPVQLRFEQTAAQNLGILLLAYGYSAFAAGRQPKGISVLSGTGLITPAL